MNNQQKLMENSSAEEKFRIVVISKEINDPQLLH